MTKRNADTFADHESVPPGALPFFAPSAKRIRSRGGCAATASPSDPLALQSRAFSSSSDEMSEASEGCAADQPDVVSAHHLTSVPSCSFACWPASADPNLPPVQLQLTALGVLTPPGCPEARDFLEQLAACMMSSQLGASTSSTLSGAMAAGVGTALWHAFAEMNVALARHFSELPTSMLRGYHSFTRAPRAQLWARFAASQGGAQLSEEPGSGWVSGWPRHLVLVRFLLEHVLGAYPTASCVLYTIEVPAWLRGWCARWGHPGNTPLRLLTLFACEATGALSPRALYIPIPE